MESWSEFLERLRIWQLKANIEASLDLFRGQKLESEDWAQQMDSLLSEYNRTHKQQVASILEEEEAEGTEEQQVSLISTNPNRNNNATKVCYNCGGYGHIAKNCPSEIQPRSCGSTRGRGYRRSRGHAYRRYQSVITLIQTLYLWLVLTLDPNLGSHHKR